jgi:hypothetical protein
MAPAQKKTKRPPLTQEELAIRREGKIRGRAERTALVDYSNPLQVMTVEQTAAREGTSRITLLRQIRAGNGPRVIQLSAKRVGIRVCDYREWQEARMR